MKIPHQHLPLLERFKLELAKPLAKEPMPLSIQDAIKLFQYIYPLAIKFTFILWALGILFIIAWHLF